MPIDFTKPVQTLDGKPVRIICTDVDHPVFPVIGLLKEKSGEFVQTYTKEGTFFPGNRPHHMDIINVPERHKHADLIIAWQRFKRRLAGMVAG